MKNITEEHEEISLPAITRLCSLYQTLEELQQEGEKSISSAALGERLGLGAHNIRKDISSIGVAGSSTAGYEIARLKELIARRLGLNEQKLVCVVGLGRLGSAILQHPVDNDFRIVAAFDSNVNRIETLKTSVELFPAFQIAEVVKRLKINMGIIAVPPASAQDVADRLIDGGIRGIVNFASVVIKPKCKGVFVRNIDIGGELRILSALLSVRTTT